MYHSDAWSIGVNFGMIFIPIDHDTEMPNMAQLLKKSEGETYESEKATEIFIFHRNNMLQTVKGNIVKAQKTQKEQYTESMPILSILKLELEF